MDNLSKLVAVVLVGCVIACGLIYVLSQFDDTQADHARAEAELTRAQTEYTRAETDRDRAASIAFQERYTLFISTLVTLTNGITLYDLLLLALTAAVAFLVAWILKGGPAKL